MENSIENNELANEKKKLESLKSAITRLKALNKIVNVALILEALGFSYIHFYNKDEDYISGFILMLLIIAKLYVEKEAKEKEREYDATDLKTRCLKQD